MCGSDTIEALFWVEPLRDLAKVEPEDDRGEIGGGQGAKFESYSPAVSLGRVDSHSTADQRQDKTRQVDPTWHPPPH